MTLAPGAILRRRRPFRRDSEVLLSSSIDRAEAFCRRFAIRVPILLGPMAGASAPSLSIAVASAGGLGSCGALLMKPDEILAWSKEVRQNSNGAFQLNIWIPDPAPPRDESAEAKVRAFLGRFGPAVPREAGDALPPDFASQCQAMLEAAPPIMSSVMGLYPPAFVRQMKQRGIIWFANISTVAEAKAAEAAGADVVVAQGSEAGGHRGCFAAAEAEATQVGLFSLLPAVVDAVHIPVVATGGIADARGVAAALALGASAAQIGTGFLRCPEAQLHPAWADALGRAAPEDTRISRVFSGRAGRSLATDYVRAATATDAPAPAPYPVQRGLTAAMRALATREGDVQRMQVWAGQSAGLARSIPAAQLVQEAWDGARALLS
jgi:nitronate monooxygenase